MTIQPKEIHQRSGKSDERVVTPDDPPTRQEVIEQLDADDVRRFLATRDAGMD